ncbi:hypothetical protein NIES4071_55160 [Calothrix sp. NIES-4071]|nr:hypothetical protein NIES4071_55160 [Calothrix sp. NIES-4071]BAZ59823.1 hypothetical protein NIES4105_55110 [Calothrix sp. NIES-4105]
MNHSRHEERGVGCDLRHYKLQQNEKLKCFHAPPTTNVGAIRLQVFSLRVEFFQGLTHPTFTHLTTGA